jgi:RNA polymerase sigma-70 factor (ECF subfamily)
MVAVYKSRHTYQPNRPFEPWLFATIRNVTRKHLCRDQERLAFEVPVDDLPELCAQDSWTADVELDKAVGQLSCRQIEALALTQLDVFRLSKLQSARAQALVQLEPAPTEHTHP